ncbi:MAG: CBS domain-containing protein [Gammaproteobacteria bacterium]|nr:CBS domain-containing protein [Gammaproteobacteria bacterium]
MSKDKPPSSNDKQPWWKQLKTTFSKTPQDRTALIDVLRDSEARNIMDPDVLMMLEGALHVAELQVRDIMVPRVQMVTIRHSAEPESIMKTVIESGHSRFPVVSDDQDDVLGILLAKDLLSCFVSDEPEVFAVKKLMRPAVFVPESKRLNVLLRDFRTNRNHMAIVVDEYGIAGLVTIEDIIEEIVGEIEDETDLNEEAYIKQHGINRYTVQAFTPIDEFNDYFGTKLGHDSYDTIGGMVIDEFGYLPKRGEIVDFSGYNVKVLRADKRRIHLLRFEKTPVSQAGTQPA